MIRKWLPDNSLKLSQTNRNGWGICVILKGSLDKSVDVKRCRIIRTVKTSTRTVYKVNSDH